MHSTRANEILDRFAGKRILVVGDVILDHYVKGKVERINPEAPVPVLHAHEEKDMTGGAGNVAKNIVSLGGRAILVSVAGQDEVADLIEKAAEREGYVARLVRDASRPSIRKSRFLVGGQQMLRVDQEETHDVEAGVARDLLDLIAKEMAEVEAVIVSDYAKGAITEVVAKELTKLATDLGKPILADVKPSRVNYFKGAGMLTPNIKEAHEYLGLNHLEQGGVDRSELARKLRDEFKSDVYLTLSDEGVQVCTSEEECLVPQEHVIKVADTSGAGDTSAAAMVLAKLAGASPQEIAMLANAAGAANVIKIGAVGVTQTEVRAMLNGDA